MFEALLLSTCNFTCFEQYWHQQEHTKNKKDYKMCVTK